MNAVSRLTAKELNLAARTVFAEAATEGLNGQMAVAQTMYDQLHHNIIGADGSGFGEWQFQMMRKHSRLPAMWHQWMIQTDGHLCMKKPEVTRNF